MKIEKFLGCLGEVRKSPNGWEARCPAHEDHYPSLSIALGEKGTVLRCHAGCAPEAIVKALGLTMADLFHSSGGKGPSRIVAEYDYVNEQETLLFQVVRLEPKAFRQRRPDKSALDGWAWNTRGIRKVLFHLPQLIDAAKAGRQVFICEGEKDVLAMEAAGFAATCNPGGAGKWHPNYVDYFKAADVVIIADKDAPGRKHAQEIAQLLDRVAGAIRVIELPDVNGKACKDPADFFEAGGQAAELDEFAQSAALWLPTPTVPCLKAAAPEFARVTAEMRGEIISLWRSQAPFLKLRSEIPKIILTALVKVGHFYFHEDLQDFDSAMFFDSQRKLLLRIRSDAFVAWLSDWVCVNRADPLFRFIQTEVETNALSGPHTTAIQPEAYWASRPGAIYLSNGDGQMFKIMSTGLELVDNGTDGVLFAAGKTLKPWKLTEPEDPFKSCSLFARAHCEAAHGKLLLQLWVYSLPTCPRSKPPICLSGEVGAGKTRTIKGIAELLGIPFEASKVEEQAEGNFWPCLNEGGLYCLDNADTKCRWLADAVASAATDGCSKRRKLYTNSETVILRANAWLAITAANPSFASDAGMSDRLLVVRMAASDEETGDSKLTEEILGARDAGISHIAETLQKALADIVPTSGSLNARHPDFASFAVKIGRALGQETGALAALRAAEADKSAFCLENDPVGVTLVAYIRDVGRFNGTAKDLLPKLIEVDADLGKRVSPKGLGKKLTMLWPHLRKAFAVAEKETDRKGFKIYTFKAAEFAEF